MRVEDLTKFEGECPIIVVFSTYMDIRIPLTKKWKKIINERGDKPNTYHNCLISYISEQIAFMLSRWPLLILENKGRFRYLKIVTVD